MKNNLESGPNPESERTIKGLLTECQDKVRALREGKAMVVDPVKDAAQQQELDKIMTYLDEILSREGEWNK